VSIADAFDAITSERPHRGARKQDAALDELSKHAGSQFDPALVKEFLSIVRTGACDIGPAAIEEHDDGVRGQSESAWPSALHKGGS
jgi:response regulator RpfG family c-di-GMP phosphodiesterase